MSPATFLLAILYARGLRIPTDIKAWKLFAFQQTINSTIPFLMITWAQQYVPAAPTVVLASTTPIFAFLITWGITRHEPATLLKLAGAMLGLAGTAVIIGLDALGGLSSNLFAEMVILLATVSFACATIFGLRLSDYDPMVVAARKRLLCPETGSRRCVSFMPYSSASSGCREWAAALWPYFAW